MSPSPDAQTRQSSPLHLDTRLVHDGQVRTSFGETSEPIFMNQGHVYETAESCEARFNDSEPGFIYARFSNPTVAMFEARMAALEGAEAAAPQPRAWRL